MKKTRINDDVEYVEAKEFIPETTWERITSNKDIHRGVIAIVRTLLNVGITAADTIPVVGEIASWGADALKSDTAKSFFKKAGLPNFDLTPSVSKKLAWSTELLEIITFGVMPSHAIETILQFKREDLGHIKKALSAIKGIQEVERRNRHIARKPLRSS